jgi:hypothetical protein
MGWSPEELDRIPEPAATAGPWVQLAVFCEDAFPARDGRLTIVKIIDQIDVAAAQNRIRSIWFVVGFLTDLHDPQAITVYTQGVQPRVVAKIGPASEGGEGSAWGPEDLQGSPSPPPNASIFLIAVHLKDLAPGLHWWVVATDERVLSKTALLVRAGELSNEPPSPAAPKVRPRGPRRRRRADSGPEL